MKRLSVFWLLALTFVAFHARGQNDNGVTSIPARRESEDVSRLTGDVENLLAANTALHKKLVALTEELRQTRDEVSRLANNSTAQDDLRRLAEKIQEVDRKREADKQLILEEFSKIGKVLATPVSSSKPDQESRAPTGVVSDKGYEYVVQPGDILVSVIGAYNTEFKKKGLKPLSLDQVLQANPGLSPKKMKVGQKIFIPMPAH